MCVCVCVCVCLSTCVRAWVRVRVCDTRERRGRAVRAPAVCPFPSFTHVAFAAPHPAALAVFEGNTCSNGARPAEGARLDRGHK